MSQVQTRARLERLTGKFKKNQLLLNNDRVKKHIRHTPGCFASLTLNTTINIYSIANSSFCDTIIVYKNTKTVLNVQQQY